MFKCGLEWTQKDLVHICLKILKRTRIKVAVESDKFETSIHETTGKDLNGILMDGYEVDDDQNSAPKNKPRPRDNADLYILNMDGSRML